MTPSATLTPQAAWAEAFVSAQLVMPTIRKSNRVNTGRYGYSYADLASIVDQVRPVLGAAGLAFAQDVQDAERGVAISTRIYHMAGHVETFGPTVIPFDGDAQAAGSAISYGRRYALLSALGIAPDDEDDDGASAKTSGGTSTHTGKAGGSNPSRGAAAAPASEPPATPSAPSSGTERADTSGSGGMGKLSGPDVVCAHPKATVTTTKPEGGQYRAGWVRCTVCDTLIPAKEVAA